MSDKKKSGSDLKDPLFRKAMEGVTPLIHDRAQPFRRRMRPTPLFREQDEGNDFIYTDDAYAGDTEHGTEEYLSFSRPGIQHRLMQELCRGRIRYEYSLDLHGLTVNFAKEELTRFFNHCRRHRVRCVHIVHGKGYGSHDRQPVLKQKLNVWLRQHALVLGFCSACARDGGTGAVYVLLKSQSHARR